MEKIDPELLRFSSGLRRRYHCWYEDRAHSRKQKRRAVIAAVGILLSYFVALIWRI